MNDLLTLGLSSGSAIGFLTQGLILESIYYGQLEQSTIGILSARSVSPIEKIVTVNILSATSRMTLESVQSLQAISGHSMSNTASIDEIKMVESSDRIEDETIVQSINA